MVDRCWVVEMEHVKAPLSHYVYSDAGYAQVVMHGTILKTGLHVSAHSSPPELLNLSTPLCVATRTVDFVDSVDSAC